MKIQFITVNDMELGDTLMNSDKITYAHELPPDEGVAWITAIHLSDGTHFVVSQSLEEIFSMTYEQ
tara:strand:+ start:746 stop:943 length:198 start_codon:yes stop_codon:yes gene_type:complete